MRELIRLVLLALAIAVGTAPALARQGRIALTFDDLPGLTILHDQAYVDQLNIKLIAGLRRHRWKPIGFVNEGKLDVLDRPRQIANIARWLDAGMELGNHTFSHASPNALGAERYIADIARGEPVVRGMLSARGSRLRWFRHPYLETGYPATVRREIDVWLSDHGYSIAPVTVDADDWEFAEPYEQAVADGDKALQRRIMRAYLAHTALRLRWSLRSARELFGRDIAQVALLHCTRLNADALDEIAALLRRSHLQVVPLYEAMRDPAYRTPDRYVGRDGPTWLERWATTRHRTLPEQGDEDPPSWIEKAYDRVDGDRQGPAAPARNRSDLTS